jgi:hypothetical protein
VKERHQQNGRDAQRVYALYEELVQKIKEAGINAGFQNSAIRLSDPARPVPIPVYPKVPQTVALAFILSLVLGVAAAIAFESLDNTVRSPEQVERLLNTEVIGSIPFVKNWQHKAGLRLAGPESAAAPANCQLGKDATNGIGGTVSAWVHTAFTATGMVSGV